MSQTAQDPVFEKNLTALLEWEAQQGERVEEVAARIRDIVQRLPEIVELEFSGVRDGDGRWHGADAFGDTLWELAELGDDWQRMTE